MENTERNIDQILLRKAYHELSAEEFLVVKEEVSSETEYNDLRAMLIAASNELTSAEEIQPKESTKAFLMNEFTKVHPASGSSAGGLGFLFPKRKAFYQKPGYQIIAIAAVIVLIFTIYPKISGDMTSNGDVAQHTVEEPSNSSVDPKSKEAVTDESNLTEESAEESKAVDLLVSEKDLETQKLSDQSLAKSKEELKQEQEKSNLFSATQSGGANDKSTEGSGYSAYSEVVSEVEEEPYMMPVAEEPMYDATVADTESLVVLESSVTTGESADQDDEVNNASYNDMDLNGGVVANEISSTEEMEDLAVSEPIYGSVAKDRANKKSDAPSAPVKKVKSLAENADLIDLFYTAM